MSDNVNPPRVFSLTVALTADDNTVDWSRLKKMKLSAGRSHEMGFQHLHPVVFS